jgi:hypothetical protein
MTRGAFVAAAVASLSMPALLPACGSSGTTPPTSFCEGRDGRICDPVGFPFVKFALAVTDYCVDEGHCPATTIPPEGATTARLSQPTAGKICMAGTAAADGYIGLSLSLSGWNEAGDEIVESLDARAHSIAGMTFTIDSPPAAGFLVVAHTVLTTDCAIDAAAACFDPFHFILRTAPGGTMDVVVDQAGPQVVPFPNFVEGADASHPFDPSAMHDVALVAGFAGDYDFCVSDFRFVDAAGTQVTPQ